MVFCEPVKTTYTNRIETESMLIGWFGMTPHSDFLLNKWKNGSLTEKAIYPVECVTPIFNSEKKDVAKLSLLNILTVAYGAIINSGFKPAQCAIVNGATGNIGACSVVLLLALGVTDVIAVGREANVLNELSVIDKRVKPYVLNGNMNDDAKNIASLCEHKDILLDHSAAPIPEPTLSCITALSNNGTAVFAGGVRADIPIMYSQVLQRQLTLKGSYMYPRYASTDLLRMIGSAQINLDLFNPHTFTLDKINEAVDKASSFKGLESCVITIANS
jgi:alcohol dehydrogenase